MEGLVVVVALVVKCCPPVCARKSSRLEILMKCAAALELHLCTSMSMTPGFSRPRADFLGYCLLATNFQLPTPSYPATKRPAPRLHFKLFLIVISAASPAMASHFWACQRHKAPAFAFLWPLAHLRQSKYLCHGQLINRKQANGAAGRALVHN